MLNHWIICQLLEREQKLADKEKQDLVIRIDGADADKAWALMRMAVVAPTPVLREMMKVNDVQNDVRNCLISMCISRMRALGEDYHSVVISGPQLPDVSYTDAARATGLESWERLNIDRPTGELDAFDFERGSYKAPFDQDEMLKLMKLQLSMEKTMSLIYLHTSPVHERRETQRMVLNRHMGAKDEWKKKGKSGKHYRLTGKLMAANARATEVSKAARDLPENPLLNRLWTVWKDLRAQCNEITKWNSQYIGTLANKAPFIPSPNKLPPDHHMLYTGEIVRTKDINGRGTYKKIPPAQPKHILRELRRDRIEWLIEEMCDMVDHEYFFGDTSINKWFTYGVITKETDDPIAHNESINQGEELAIIHNKNKWKEENIEPDVDTIQLEKMRVLHAMSSQCVEVVEQYLQYIGMPEVVKA